MQNPIQYTPSDVWGLKAKIEKMLEQVIDAIITVPDWTKVDFQRHFSVDGNIFNFIFKTVTSSREELLSGNPPAPDTKAVIASVKLHGQEFAISSEINDHENEFLLSPELLESLTNTFINDVIKNMARNWGEVHALPRIIDLFKENGEKGKLDLFDGLVVGNYSPQGYELVVYKDDDKKEVIYSAKEHNVLYDAPYPYGVILSNCVCNLIPILLTKELIYKGQWSNTLCE